MILSNGIVPLKERRKLPVVLADDVQCRLSSCGAEAERLSMAVRRAMMVSLIGRARMACSSASFVMPPFRMIVTFVLGEELGGEVVLWPCPPATLLAVADFAAAAAYRGLGLYPWLV